ncbi:MAG: ABC transporter ATP-binding protein [Rhodospirillales bacterium]|nr:ABC transporter ATP-binding protein [Rhodospirillales bacterium]
MIEIDDLSVSYGAVPALAGVSLTIGVNEFVAIIGPNGAGKTTLLKSISNVVTWKSGDIRLDGRSIRGRDAWDIARAGVAHVPEGRRVFGQMTVEENLRIGAMSARADPKLMQFIYDLFPNLATRRRSRAITLSGGEQQMLAIGRALMSRPRLLMLDEPSMGLAPALVEQVFAHINKLFESSELSVLLIEQRATEALEASQRCYVLERGRVAMNGPSEKLLMDPAIQSTYLGVAARG